MSNSRYNQQLLIRLTPEEKELAFQRAQETGLTVSEYMRRCALKQRLPQQVTAVSAQTYQQLGQIAITLNQLAIAVDQGSTLTSTDLSVLTRLEGLLHQVRLEITSGKIEKGIIKNDR
jgi:hypothetical protein